MVNRENIFKQLREDKGVTQKQCSEATGISMRTITRYENGTKVGNPDVIRVLARYYGVSIDYLYGDE